MLASHVFRRRRVDFAFEVVENRVGFRRHRLQFFKRGALLRHEILHSAELRIEVLDSVFAVFSEPRSHLDGSGGRDCVVERGACFKHRLEVLRLLIGDDRAVADKFGQFAGHDDVASAVEIVAREIAAVRRASRSGERRIDVDKGELLVGIRRFLHPGVKLLDAAVGIRCRH